MKKFLILALALLALCPCTPPATAESLTPVHCAQQGFSLMIPSDKTASWEEGVGFRVSVGAPGYVPYVAVYRRDEAAKFKNPVNYLNNTYREYMENRYNNNVGTNPCRSYEIGGKTLYAAHYHYEAGGNKLVLTLMIEVRPDGDVEYHAKYVEGKAEETLAVLDTVVRHYQPDGAAADNAPSGALAPADISGQAVNTLDGAYWARVSDTDRIVDGGFFTVSLYLRDEYPPEGIEALRPGDAVRVNGQVYTVASLENRDNGALEMIPQEDFDGYIVFEKAENAYIVRVNDWTPVSFLADYKVMLPLPNDFAFGWISGGEDAAVYDADAFIALISDPASAPLLRPYNTMIGFQNDLVMTILHADYPAGPEQQ